MTLNGRELSLAPVAVGLSAYFAIGTTEAACEGLLIQLLGEGGSRQERARLISVLAQIGVIQSSESGGSRPEARRWTLSPEGARLIAEIQQGKRLSREPVLDPAEPPTVTTVSVDVGGERWSAASANRVSVLVLSGSTPVAGVRIRLSVMRARSLDDEAYSDRGGRAEFIVVTGRSGEVVINAVAGPPAREISASALVRVV